MMSKNFFCINVLFITLCFFIVLAYPSLATTLKVNTTGGEYTSIQAAIEKTKNRDVIVVAKGVYKETINLNGKTITIRSLDGPSVTTIDGNFQGSVVTFNHGEDANSILNGFTIRNGLDVSGGGIFCESSDPNIVNCIITHNTAIDSGGGIACIASNPVLVNCTIIDNQAFGDGGAGIFCSTSSPKIINCTISNNEAYSYNGGGIYCEYQSRPTITNSIFWGNMAAGGSDNYEIYIKKDDQSTITINYSDVQYSSIDKFGGIGNINEDPLFLQKEFGNYYLKKDSPCIDTGTSAEAPSKDQKGIKRPQGNNKIDMGAYEIVPRPTDNTPPIPDVEGLLPPITAECEINLTTYPTATDFYAGKIAGFPSPDDPNILSENTIISQQGRHTIQWQYDDGQGNVGYQYQEIIVEDTTVPIPNEYSLPTIISDEEVTLASPMGTDNCLGEIEATTNNPITYSQPGTYTVTWEYRDNNENNRITQTQTVIILPPNTFDPNVIDPNAIDPNLIDPNAININKIVYKTGSGGGTCFISSLIGF